MESAREVDLFSQLSTVSVRNYDDTIIVHLRPMLEIATSFAPPSSNAIKADGVVLKKMDSSVVHISSAKQEVRSSGHILTLKEQPVEIVIEQPLDESSLVNLLKLLGEHALTSMSSEQKVSLFDVLKENPLFANQINIKKTGIRIVFRIPKQTFSPLYRLPPLCEHFVGRAKELRQLQTRHNQDKNIVQIAGTGGIGKSQLANHYAHLQFREKNYEWIIWVVGGGDLQKSRENLSSQFLELGVALGLVDNQLLGEDLYQLIYDRLAAKGRGLIIVDDAPNYIIVKPFLPEQFSHPEMDVLITTRNSRTFNTSTSIIKIILNVFTLDDTKHYIQKLTKQAITEADAEELAKTLDPHPLALTQALTNIGDKQYGLDHDPFQLEYQHQHRKVETTMQEVVKSSLEKIKIICKTQEAYERTMRVLLATSYLAPEVPIPKALLGKWLPEDEGEIYIDAVLEALRTLSLIEEPEQKATYRIHKAIQDILKHYETAESSQEKILKWKEIIDRHLNSKHREDGLEIHRALTAHMTFIAQNLSIFDDNLDDSNVSNTLFY